MFCSEGFVPREVCSSSPGTVRVAPRKAAVLPTPLASVTAFRGLSPRQLGEIETCLSKVAVSRGEVLMRQGEPADALFLVASGRFTIEVDGRRVAEVGTGSPIGEIAFFAGGVRTATVTALRDSIVLRLPRTDFVALTDRHPAMLKPIAVTLARRLADALAVWERPAQSLPRTIAVIGAGHYAVPDNFRRGLARALSRFGETTAIDAASLRKAMDGEADLDAEAVTSWLNRQELRYSFVLYFAGAEITPFAAKAIRQADQVLVVGDGDQAAPAPSALERFAFDTHPVAARRLVLLHAPGQAVSGTARWLDLRPVAMHHHLIAGDAPSFDRLARFISGTAIGFVASGGGALCAAHIGVYRAFVEAGIIFDLVGGTSGGGAMAAAFAMGANPKEVSARVAAIFVEERALKRLTWPRYSLLDHTLLDRALHAHYGDTDIEDLWTGFFAVSTCLNDNTLHLIRRGPVWEAVRATGAIPGLLPPFYRKDGQILVDGSLLDNVPVRPMRGLKIGPNVVVNLRPEDLPSVAVDYKELPSRGKLVLRLLNPFRRKQLPAAPGVATVLMRSLMVGRERLAGTLEPDDLLVSPPLPDNVSGMDWHRHAELTERAYEHTSRLIEKLRANGHALFH